MGVRSMPRWAAATLLLSCAALAAASGMGIALSEPATRPPAWSQIRTFSGPVTVIASVGRRDAWLTGIGTDNKIFVQQWKGARWRAVSTPPAMFTAQSVIVGASSATNAWVFTFNRPAVAASYPVGWHWTGHAWRSYRLLAGSTINATAVISRTDAWAFGVIGGDNPLGMIGAGKPYVIRYDGRKWRRVHAPVQPTSASALNGHDIWIVGPTAVRRKTFPFGYEAADWVGKSWRILKFPQVRVPKGMYAASAQILAAGPADIWVDFDLFSNSATGPDMRTLLHYDAGHWTQINVPHEAISWSSNLATDGRGGIWLALVPAGHQFASVVYDYRDGHWSKAAVFAKPGHYTVISSIARVPGTDLAWAGGYAGHTTGTPRPHGVLYEHRR